MKEAIVDYQELESLRQSELQTEIQDRLSERVADVQEINSLRHTILGLIVDRDYEKAMSEIERFAKGKSEYPEFMYKAKVHIQHSINLMMAIKAKREFAALRTGSAAKHQEVSEKVVEHFEELKHYLKKIEIIDKEVKINDLRSTVLILKAFFYSVFVILGVAFFRQFLTGGLGATFLIVFDDLVTDIMDKIKLFL